MAEGKVLETNALGGEKRSCWGQCVNWAPEQFSKDCALLRRVETAHSQGLGNRQCWGSNPAPGSKPC